MFRSDVVGSLLRPKYLKEARAQFEAGKLTDMEFKRVEDRSVNEAIALQLRTGIDVLTDGEMRRYAFWGHLIDAVDGFDKHGGWSIPFRNEQGEEISQPRPVVVSRLRRKRPMCAEEFTYLRARTDHPAKATFVSAQQAAAYYDAKKSSAAYPTMDTFLADLVDLLRDEVAELVRLGCVAISDDGMPVASGFMMRKALDTSLENSLDDAALSVMISNPSEDVREGIVAFREKRQPNFKGR